jgi:hypothetical protein
LSRYSGPFRLGRSKGSGIFAKIPDPLERPHAAGCDRIGRGYDSAVGLLAEGGTREAVKRHPLPIAEVAAHRIDTRLLTVPQASGRNQKCNFDGVMRSSFLRLHLRWPLRYGFTTAGFSTKKRGPSFENQRRVDAGHFRIRKTKANDVIARWLRSCPMIAPILPSRGSSTLRRS